MKKHKCDVCGRLIALLFAAHFLLSCGGADGNGGVGRAAHRDSAALKIALLPTTYNLPLFVAAERGIFARHGVAVELAVFKASMDCDTAFMGGSADVIATDAVKAAWMESRGVELSAVLAADVPWTLVAGKSTRVKSAKQLADKNIAMARNSVSDHLTRKLLDSIRVKTAAYPVQVNDLDIRLGMLLNGELDAAWLPEPYSAAALEKGHTKVLGAADGWGCPGVLAFKGKAAYGRMGKFIEAYDEACDSLNTKGVAAYGGLLEKHSNAGAAVPGKNGKIVFKKWSKPDAGILERARKFVGKK